VAREDRDRAATDDRGGGAADRAGDATPGPTDRSGSPGTTTDAAAPAPTPGEVWLARQGNPQTICSERVKADPGIYAVTDPAFGADWREADVDDRYRRLGASADDGDGLDDDHTVVGLAGEWGARAYPLGVLWHHEVVNDTPDGRPVAVTYCPLCRSGLVARRVVDGTTTTFVVSGLLWRAPGAEGAAAAAGDDLFGATRAGGEAAVRNAGNLVMYDRATGSYWSQILATAICGPLRGTDLDVVPSTVTTWGEWRDSHPGTDVLLPPPRSGTVEPGAVDPGTPPGYD